MILRVSEHATGVSRPGKQMAESCGDRNPKKKCKSKAPNKTRPGACRSFCEQQSEDQPEERREQHIAQSPRAEGCFSKQPAGKAGEKPKERVYPNREERSGCERRGSNCFFLLRHDRIPILGRWSERCRAGRKARRSNPS